MDQDKIKKLIRLANNNPNENEANLAARKVCKMLADCEFEAIDEKPKTWNDVKRSTEPAWRATQTPGSQTGWDYINDFINKMNQERANREKRDPSNAYRRSWVHEPKYGPIKDEKYETSDIPYDNGYNPGDKEWWNIPYQHTKPRPEKQLRKCVKCGKEVETRRVNNVFTCNECEWSAYKDGF